jgi:uncharacterized phage protein (TIGR02220 family)
MAQKLTKRKAFKFYRSYYDVYNELSNADKLKFIEAILDRQFLGIKPNNLTGMARFAYLSQEHSIDLQVKGYEDATKSSLCTENEDVILENNDPYKGGYEGPNVDPPMQEKEKEKEKEQQIDSSKLLSVYNSILGKTARVVNAKTKTQIKDRLKEGYTKEDIVNAIRNASKDPHHIEFNYKYLTLEFITRPDKLDRFVNMGDFKIKTQIL